MLVPALGACTYQTDQVYQPAVGVNYRTGAVDVLGAVVVSSSDGTGTFVASLANNEVEKSDRLIGVSGEGLEAQLAAPVEIGPEDLVNLADSGAVSVTGEGIQAGKFVRVSLEFESGEKAEVNAPVVPDNQEYTDVKTARPSTTATP
jgi:copper(I)-binding protein